MKPAKYYMGGKDMALRLVSTEAIKAIQREAWLQGMKDAMKACGKGLARANIAEAMTRLPAVIAPSDPKNP